MEKRGSSSSTNRREERKPLLVGRRPSSSDGPNVGLIKDGVIDRQQLNRVLKYPEDPKNRLFMDRVLQNYYAENRKNLTLERLSFKRPHLNSGSSTDIGSDIEKVAESVTLPSDLLNQILQQSFQGKYNLGAEGKPREGRQSSSTASSTATRSHCSASKAGETDPNFAHRSTQQVLIKQEQDVDDADLIWGVEEGRETVNRAQDEDSQTIDEVLTKARQFVAISNQNDPEKSEQYKSLLKEFEDVSRNELSLKEQVTDVEQQLGEALNTLLGLINKCEDLKQNQLKCLQETAEVQAKKSSLRDKLQMCLKQTPKEPKETNRGDVVYSPAPPGLKRFSPGPPYESEYFSKGASKCDANYSQTSNHSARSLPLKQSKRSSGGSEKGNKKRKSAKPENKSRNSRQSRQDSKERNQSQAGPVRGSGRDSSDLGVLKKKIRGLEGKLSALKAEKKIATQEKLDREVRCLKDKYEAVKLEWQVKTAQYNELKRSNDYDNEGTDSRSGNGYGSGSKTGRTPTFVHTIVQQPLPEHVKRKKTHRVSKSSPIPTASGGTRKGWKDQYHNISFKPPTGGGNDPIAVASATTASATPREQKVPVFVRHSVLD